MTENDLVTKVLDAAFSIHREYGPGMLESVYEALLFSRLRQCGLQVERQTPIYLNEAGLENELAFRLDLRIEGRLIVEVKSVQALSNVHKKQLLTYLKVTDCKLGVLINFNESLLRNGIVRIANGL